MPTGLTIKRRPIKSQAAGKIMNDEIRGELKLIGDEVVGTYFDEVVRFWDSDISFRVTVQVTASRVILTIKAVGDELAVQRWNMVDSEGRDGGVTITAKNPSDVMRYLSNYVKKTGLAVASSGGAPGSRYGDWVSARSVTQGAVEPGGYTERAKNELIEPALDRRIRAAYRRAFRKVTGRSI
jgi:hypothetical protein